MKKTDKQLQQEIFEKLKNETKIADYISKKYKFIELDGKYVEVCDAKPAIDRKLYYDDETVAPDSSDFEVFRRHNLRRHQVEEKKLRIHQRGNSYRLVIRPNYYHEDMAQIEYELRQEWATPVTEEQLEIINEAIREVQADYEKRLERYWKRYKDKVITVGYWANR